MTWDSGMTDAQFLQWLHKRLINVYRENPDVDFVVRLKAIADMLKAAYEFCIVEEADELQRGAQK